MCCFSKNERRRMKKQRKGGREKRKKSGEDTRVVLAMLGTKTLEEGYFGLMITQSYSCSL